MQISKQFLPKSVIEITFELSVEELQPYLEDAATEMSNSKPIAGFRPGKVPFAIAKQQYGELAILQAAVSTIIGQTYYDYIEKEKVETVEQPKIDVVKIAPGNPFIYKATAAILPKVELAEYTTLKTKPMEKVEAKPEEIEKIISDIQNMRAKEVSVDRPAEMKDKVDIDFETFVDQVAIPGGKSEKYPLVLGTKQFIPGFEEAIVGVKAGESKEFELNFPKDYKEEKLAGKKALFKVKLNQVFKLELPEVTDEFAKTLGLKTVADLKSNLQHNLEHEKLHKEQETKDLEMLNLLIDKTKFEDLPEALITNETHKMMNELKGNVEHQGLNFTDYLNHLKKKEADLMLDFTPDAVKRVKTSIIIREVAKKENLMATLDEVKLERMNTLARYSMNPQLADRMKEIEENINHEDSTSHFEDIVTNHKVVDFLRKTMIPGFIECSHNHH